MQHFNDPAVLPDRMGGGPHGLGDPNDRSLRKVESEVLIPKIMRDLAKKEKCNAEVEAFTDCCKNSNVFMVFSCQKENNKMQECLTKWYKDEDFKNRCKEIYLDERSEYRLTGIRKKQKQAGSNRV